MTRTKLLRAMRQRLREAGIGSFALDARLLLLHALAIDDMALLRDPDHTVSETEAARMTALIDRRIAREPVARILGHQEFYGLPFALSDDTLIPRPETEMLVDAALARLPPHQPARLLDLGTGTGCILLAILHHRPQATGLGIDTSEGALRTAAVNAAALGLAGRAIFQPGHWADGLTGSFDLIVSNPPYIDSAVVPRLAPEVAGHDPLLALDGGADGLDAYHAILPALPHLLKPGGAALLEIGFDQAIRLGSLAAAAGLSLAAIRQDLAGHDRMAVLLPAGDKTMPDPAKALGGPG
ncbi:MAG: peptide chain release factor N(5)-glutamine methyltransferase [Beijerinckiaceae bacterium]